ncbi:hypothetical protein Anas_06057, partial [Armadillidium nasatum]
FILVVKLLAFIDVRIGASIDVDVAICETLQAQVLTIILVNLVIIYADSRTLAQDLIISYSSPIETKTTQVPPVSSDNLYGSLQQTPEPPGFVYGVYISTQVTNSNSETLQKLIISTIKESPATTTYKDTPIFSIATPSYTPQPLRSENGAPTMTSVINI